MSDKDFSHWIAGFVDGEGCFFMAPVNRPGGYRPSFSVSVRADDSEIVQKMRDFLDVGTTHFYRATSGSRVIRWSVQAQADCQKLVQFFERFPLRAKKRNDFEVWARAVEVAANLRSGRANNTDTYSKLRELRDELRAGRKVGLLDA